MRDLIFLLIIIILLSGCAGRGGFREVKFEDDIYQDIKIFGILDRDFAAKNFGGFRLVFENRLLLITLAVCACLYSKQQKEQ